MYEIVNICKCGCIQYRPRGEILVTFFDVADINFEILKALYMR